MSKTPKPVSLAPVKSLAAASVGAPAAAVLVKNHQPVAVAEMTPEVTAAKTLATKPMAPASVAAKPVLAKAIPPKATETKSVPAKAGVPVSKPVAVKPPVLAVAKTVPAKVLAAKPVIPKAGADKSATIKFAAAKAAPVAIAVSKSAAALEQRANAKTSTGGSKMTNVKASSAKSPEIKAVPVAKTEAIRPAASGPVASKSAIETPLGSVAALTALFDPKKMMPSLNFPGFTGADAAAPSFGTDMMANMASQMVAAARTMGEVQAALLDHGVAQLKAGMTELEECARSTNPSDVVVIQARAIRRSADDLTNAIKTVSAKAGKGFTKP